MAINILIFSDLLVKYFSARKEFDKSVLEYNLVSIIDNPNNKFVLSKKYLEFLDQRFHPNSELYDDYSKFMTFIIDGNCEVIESNNSESIEEEFVYISNNCTSTTISVIDSDQNLQLKNYLCIDKVDICPKSKVYLGLLKDRKAIVRYNDFVNNTDLEFFFKEVFSISRGISSTVIIERYANINHPYFDYFAEKNLIVKYYKYRVSIADGRSLRKKFNLVELYNTTDPELVHERLIILGNLIVNIDEDPMNLDVARKTWTISLSYSQHDAQNLLKKCSNFAKAGLV